MRGRRGRSSSERRGAAGLGCDPTVRKVVRGRCGASIRWWVEGNRPGWLCRAGAAFFSF